MIYFVVKKMCLSLWVHGWLPEKEEFYSNLNMEVIRDAGCMHAKRVCKDFEIKNLGEYYSLYLKSDTLLLAVFSKTSEKCV